MEEGKRAYKEGFAKLKELKGEIEHLQHLLEQSRRRLQQGVNRLGVLAEAVQPRKAADRPDEDLAR